MRYTMDSVGGYLFHSCGSIGLVVAGWIMFVSRVLEVVG